MVVLLLLVVIYAVHFLRNNNFVKRTDAKHVSI